MASRLGNLKRRVEEEALIRDEQVVNTTTYRTVYLPKDIWESGIYRHRAMKHLGMDPERGYQKGIEGRDRYYVSQASESTETRVTESAVYPAHQKNLQQPEGEAVPGAAPNVRDAARTPKQD